MLASRVEGARMNGGLASFQAPPDGASRGVRFGSDAREEGFIAARAVHLRRVILISCFNGVTALRT
jgi:hypothetical protein